MSDEMLKELDAQRLLMIAVSTGREGIDNVSQEYFERHERLRRELKSLGLDYPVPYEDLWRWYGKWSSGDLPSYQSRREYISDLFRPIVESVRQRSGLHGARMFEEPTGWAKVDNTLDLIRRRLEQAKTEVEWQGVGHACREALIDVAQSIYDPAKHPTTDGVTPSATDAKRRLEATSRWNSPAAATRPRVATRKPPSTLPTSCNTVAPRRSATPRSALKRLRR